MSQRSETYRVELLGFPGAGSDDATVALAEAFGIAEDLAGSYVSEAPCAVRTGVDGSTAREYTQTLLGIGASVRVVAETSGRAREFTATDLLALGGADEPGSAAQPAPPPAPAEVTGSKPVSLEERVSRTAACPACGHRQGPAPVCENCGYEFPKSLERVTSRRLNQPPSDSQPPPSHPDIDVFEKLRTTGERLAVEARASRKRRRRISLSRSQIVVIRRRRVILYAILGVLVVATLLFVFLTPGEKREGDPVPPGAIPPPPGFDFRRL